MFIFHNLIRYLQSIFYKYDFKIWYTEDRTYYRWTELQQPKEGLWVSSRRMVRCWRAHRARLTITHVIDSLTGFDYASSDLRRIQYQKRLDSRESIETAIAKQVVGVTEIDIRIESGLRLIKMVNESSADLVVM